MNARSLWSQILIAVGGVAMIVGAIDPLEGSLLILPGSGLVALGAWLGDGERRLVAFRGAVFALIAIGVAALFGLSTAGGVGGEGGVSPWWALAILPYPVGWSVGIWGPGSPRWMLWLGIVVGTWYLGLLAMALRAGRFVEANIAIAVVGVLTIGGCIYSLWRPGRSTVLL